MSRRRLRDQEEGQIIPALLLVVVVLVFFALLFAQVGSAAEQKTQTQTAADSGAVAAGHNLRENGIGVAALSITAVFPKIGAALFSGIRPPDPLLTSAACGAVQQNWTSNPHGGAGINCGTDVLVSSNIRTVTVDVTAPPGQVVDGPAKVQNERAKADATARVTIDHCPRAALTPAGKAVADWVADRTMQMMGGPSSNCFTPDDGTTLTEIELDFTGISLSVLGPPKPILLSVSNGMRVELVD